MDKLGINIALLSLQLFYLLLLVIWVILLFSALHRLRGTELTELERGLWVIVTLLLPIIGAATFLYLHPRVQKSARSF